MDSTVFIVFATVTLALIGWVAVLALHTPPRDPMKGSRTRHLSDDTQ
jgi:hypothetical protein